MASTGQVERGRETARQFFVVFDPRVKTWETFLKKEKWIFAWPWQLKAKSGVGWVGAFLSKGAILPWAGGQGRKAQQSYLEGKSLELCWAFSEE